MPLANLEIGKKYICSLSGRTVMVSSIGTPYGKKIPNVRALYFCFEDGKYYTIDIVENQLQSYEVPS